MDKKIQRHQKTFTIVLLMVLLIFAGVVIVSSTYGKPITYEMNEQIYENVGSYSSNRYTQHDELSENTSSGSVLRLEAKENGDYDELILNNTNYEMYFNRFLNIIKIKNLKTSYVWASALDRIDSRDIKTPYYASILASSVNIGYYFYNSANDSYADAEYTYINRANVDLTIPVDATEKPLKLSPNTSEMRVTSTVLSNGVKLAINVFKYQITLNVYFELSTNGLTIKVPDAEITEQKHLIASIYLAPAFGATKNNEEPGYMVIPDGSGALIRYGKSTSTSQIALRYYGKDYGLGTILTDYNLNEEKILSAPVFGLINGIKQDGILGIIESGAYSAELLISLAGTTDIMYNYLTPRYLLRHQYLLYGVTKTLETYRNGEDIVVTYGCLSDNDATYVGMANKYQKYLKDHQELKPQTQANYKMRLEMIMSETVPALIGTKNVTLTSLKELNQMLESLTSNDVNSLTLVLKGWNKGGLSGNTPYDIAYNTKVGSTNAFKTLIKDQQGLGNQVYFYNDYQIAYDKGEASIRYDVARTIQRLKMNYTDPNAPLYQKYYMLYPEKSLELASNNVKEYEKRSMGAIAIDSLSNELYSYYYKGTIYHRYQGASEYQKLLATMAEHFDTALYNPSAYMWKNLDSYFDMPMYANQFSIYTDTVPFIPYVLKGCVDYYGSSINFFSSSTDQLLRLLDFGALPSYILTSEQSRALKYTNSNRLFTTRYQDWEESIIATYKRFEQAFKNIGNATVTSREILSVGVVSVTYSNGLNIVINYTEQPYGSIAANSFSLTGGNV